MTSPLLSAEPLARAAYAAHPAVLNQRWQVLHNSWQQMELLHQMAVQEVARREDDIALPFRTRGLMRAMQDLRMGMCAKNIVVVERALREIARIADSLAEGEYEQPRGPHGGPLPSNVIRLPLRRVTTFHAPTGPEAA